MWRRIIRWWKGTQRTQGPALAITAAELDGRFAAAPDNPLWEATLAVVVERINSLGTDAANPKLADREILWRVAGVDALMGLLEELQEREAKAREGRMKKEA